MQAATRERLAVHAAPPALRPWAVCVLLRHADAGDVLRARVQATTFACLNVVTAGEVRCDGTLQPPRFLAGPASRPRETSASAPLASASLVLAPGLLEPWLGLRPDGLVDALVDVDALQHPGLHALCAALASACGDADALATAWRLLEDAVPSLRPPELALPLLREHGVAGAAAAVGCSERQYRRRFQRQQGLGPAAWLRVRRWEEALQGLLAPEARPALARLAAGHGYADQAHLTRDTQDFVHASPARLRHAHDWSLAPARVRILQDGEGDAA
ncbi:helix-turn-helix domain-containing protein [Ramlibacter sp. USB13]|uniref:Helix-turn-helix domain-containing protein n=1 Tax=Ramlibacter cellulosilyticus TaxID=2764187 RepID=A0A923MLQ3_9BURK|nr:helix-turn-helix domain-containing protein [Ramlibacter cellulosilyticus]MBC5781952.1 helix-turn-helix domain-containing protein [Ramlibacter cellulosilyticus]